MQQVQDNYLKRYLKVALKSEKVTLRLGGWQIEATGFKPAG